MYMVCRTSYNQVQAIICVDTVSATIMQPCRCEPCYLCYMHISPCPPRLFSFHFMEPWWCHRMSHSGGTWSVGQISERITEHIKGKCASWGGSDLFLCLPPPMHCRQPLQNLHRRRLDGDASVWHRGELWIQSERHQRWCEWGSTTVTLRAGGWEEFN